MGLVKSSIKYGGLIYAVNVISKGVAAHHESKTATPPMSEGFQRSQEPLADLKQSPQPDTAGYLNRFGAKTLAIMNAMESRLESKSEQIIIEKCLPFSSEESLVRAAETDREEVVGA